MTLEQFRDLTAHLNGDLRFLCADESIQIVWHDDDYLSIEHDGDVEVNPNCVVLWEQ